jgi:hypothetical protein
MFRSSHSDFSERPLWAFHVKRNVSERRDRSVPLRANSNENPFEQKGKPASGASHGPD